MAEKSFLEVKVFCSQIIKKEGFKGKAISVSSKNKLGWFDVLPKHTNFITLIFEDLIIQTDEKKTINYQFQKGVLQVSENAVNIFLGV